MKIIDMKYLCLLVKEYFIIVKIVMEIINFEVIMNFLKGMEYFLSDVYGEYSVFE